MEIWLNRLKNAVNYLLPSANYTGKKITNKGWISAFIPIAPYTAVFMCGVLVYLGITTKIPRPFLLTPQGLIAVLATFWTLVSFIFYRIIQKKHRNSAILLLIANFIPLQSFLSLMLFMEFQSSMQKKFAPQHQQISQIVRNKIADDNSCLDQRFKAFEKEIMEHQNKVQNSINKMKDFHLGALERFWQTGK